MTMRAGCKVEMEQLGAIVADEASDTAAALRDHVRMCAHCRQRLAQIERVDGLLDELPRPQASGETLLAVRRALGKVVRPPVSEVMTLDEVTAFLRLTPEQLDQVIGDLPVFEVGGQVRMRRARLIDWIKQRERHWEQMTLHRALASARIG